MAEHFVKNTGGYNPFGGYQRQQTNQKPALTCEHCGCPYLEEKKVGRFHNRPIVVGSPLPTVTDEPAHYLYICIQCGHPVQQPLQYLGVDISRQEFKEIFDILQAHANPPDESGS